jgi:hypothetical protein
MTARVTGIDVNWEFEPLQHLFRISETRYEYLDVSQSKQGLIERLHLNSMGDEPEQLEWRCDVKVLVQA